MKPIIPPRISLALALAASLTAAMADTIKKKNGEVLEGTITKEAADSVTIEVKEKGITDWVKVMRAEIAEVKKASPDEKEADDLIAKLTPTPDAMAVAEYEKRIKSEIQPWLDKHKTSRKRPEVDKMLKLYNEELAKVKAGEFKLRGVWITPEEAKWNEYNINARKLRAKFEELLQAKKPVEAYGVFAEMELSGSAAVDFPPVVEAMKKLMPAMQSAISQAIERYPVVVEDRKKLLGQQTPEKRKELEAVIKQEEDDYRLKVAAEKKNKVPVQSFYPYDLKSIQTSLDAAKKESARIGAIDTAAMTAANKKFEQGLKDMHAKAFLSARNNFEAAAKFHAKDATVKKKVEEATKANDAAKAKPAGK